MTIIFRVYLQIIVNIKYYNNIPSIKLVILLYTHKYNQRNV